VSMQIAENSGLDPLLWAKRPQSQNAWDLIVKEAKVDPRFKSIVEIACRRWCVLCGLAARIRLELRGTEVRSAAVVFAGER
jgi:hypothetical protein